MNQYAREDRFFKDRFKNQIINHKKLIINSLIVVFILSSFGLILSVQIINFFKSRAPFDLELIQTAPPEVFIDLLRIAFLFGLLMSLPFIVYQAVKLKNLIKNRADRKNIIILIAVAFLLFWLGILFALYVSIPLSLYFLLGLNSGLAEIHINISEYISYCLGLILISGLLFEMPLFTFLMVKTDLIKLSDFVAARKHVLAVILIMSFILVSPSELLALIFLILTILLFYVISIYLIKAFNK